MWETRVLSGFPKIGGKGCSPDFPPARHFHRPPSVSCLPVATDFLGRAEARFPFNLCELPLTHLSGQRDQDVDSQPEVS